MSNEGLMEQMAQDLGLPEVVLRNAKIGYAALEELRERLSETFVSLEGARNWLASPNGYLGATPASLLRVGDINAVHLSLTAMEAAIFV